MCIDVYFTPIPNLKQTEDITGGSSKGDGASAVGPTAYHDIYAATQAATFTSITSLFVWWRGWGLWRRADYPTPAVTRENTGMPALPYAVIHLCQCGAARHRRYWARRGGLGTSSGQTPLPVIGSRAFWAAAAAAATAAAAGPPGAAEGRGRE